jgi:hypothetical protein
MTDTEQRVAIATWLGWSCIEDNSKPLMMAEGSIMYGYPPKGAVIGKKLELPDFLNDLNAMHSAIQSQSKEFRMHFESVMDNYCAGKGKLWCELEAKDFAEVFLQVKLE